MQFSNGCCKTRRQRTDIPVIPAIVSVAIVILNIITTQGCFKYSCWVSPQCSFPQNQFLTQLKNQVIVKVWRSQFRAIDLLLFLRFSFCSQKPVGFMPLLISRGRHEAWNCVDFNRPNVGFHLVGNLSSVSEVISCLFYRVDKSSQFSIHWPRMEQKRRLHVWMTYF